jgi:hypothetical protein
MGSGKYLKHAIEKYGLENFEKEILHVFDTPGEMYAKEAEIVTEEFISTNNTYNLKVGGFGGYDYLNNWKENPTHTKEHLQKMVNNMWAKPENRLQHSKRQSVRFIKLHKEGKIKYDTFTGKQHTKETKEKMSYIQKNIDRNGIKNPSFGTMWITNGSQNKKVKKQIDIPEGWYKGRI